LAKNENKSKNTQKSRISKPSAKSGSRARGAPAKTSKATRVSAAKAPQTKQKNTKPLNKKADEQAEQQRLLEESRRAALILEDRPFALHMDEKAGPNASEILKILAKAPKTDEDIAAQLGMKVNDIRRALNIMNSYSIVKYDVNKDSKGWLIFKWKLNQEKLEGYVGKLRVELSTVEEPELQNGCNDFFMCKKCYPEQKVVLPFDSAFESGFNCDSCGKPYAILNRQEASELFKTQKE